MEELTRDQIETILADMSANVTHHTIAARQGTVRKWIEFRNHPKELAEWRAVQILLGMSRSKAILEVKEFISWLIEKGASWKTVHVRSWALASLWRRANDMGFVSYTIPQLKLGKKVGFRDMRGPPWADIERMFAVNDLDYEDDARASAVLALFTLCQLRSNEVHTLFVEHWDPTNHTLKVAGKGCRGVRQVVAVPDRAAALIEKWLEHRGREPGRLFLVHENTLGNIIKSNAHRAKLPDHRKLSPHRLRHSGLTRLNAIAADLGMTIADVAQAARHADPRTTMRYLDNPEDRALALRNAMSSPDPTPSEIHALKPNLHKLA